MNLIEENKIKNPAVKFLEWSGGEGRLKYYDKELGENMFIDTPVHFVKLDNLSTITGWSDIDESRIWSNEVRNLKTDILRVKTKNGTLEEGLWEDIKESIKAKGAKFASSVYVAMITSDNEVELCHLKLFGSGITPWIDFNKEMKAPTFSISAANAAKKGKVVYYTPEFELYTPTKEQMVEAHKLALELREYHKSYFEASKEAVNSVSA